MIGDGFAADAEDLAHERQERFLSGCGFNGRVIDDQHLLKAVGQVEDRVESAAAKQDLPERLIQAELGAIIHTDHLSELGILQQ